MKTNILVVALSMLIGSAWAQGQFGTPPGRQQGGQQSQQTQPTISANMTLVVIPLYRINPLLIAQLFGGDVIYDEGGMGGGSGSSGYGGSSDYGSSGYGSSSGSGGSSGRSGGSSRSSGSGRGGGSSRSSGR